MRRLLPLLLLAPLGAQAQSTVTLSPSVTQGNGVITTVVTWDTSPRLTAADACTASGGHPDWSGPRAGSGSQTITIATSGTLPLQLSCQFPGDSLATFTWTPAATNTDGSPYTDAKTTRIKYSFNAGFVPSDPCTALGVVCVDLDDTTTPRPSMHTVTGITNTGTLLASVAHINQGNLFSDWSNVAQKIFTGAVVVTESVSITVNPVPGAPSNLVLE